MHNYLALLKACKNINLQLTGYTINQSPGQDSVLNRSFRSERKKCSCNVLWLVIMWMGNVSFPCKFLDTRKFEGKEDLWTELVKRFTKCFFYTLCIFSHLNPSCSFSGHPHLFHSIYKCEPELVYLFLKVLQWNLTHCL